MKYPHQSISPETREKLKKHLKTLMVTPLNRRRAIVLWIGAFLSIFLLVSINDYLKKYNLDLLLVSFGASTVILYALPKSPFSSFRSLVGGHTLSAFIGIICFPLAYISVPLACGVAVATALLAMLLTNTLHPPGGATAFNFIIIDRTVYNVGIEYILFPTFIGAIIVFCIIKTLQFFLHEE